jgi:hypothetical protein
LAPRALLAAPVVLLYNDLNPTATLPFTKLLNNALTPTAVLQAPVTFCSNV